MREIGRTYYMKDLADARGRENLVNEWNAVLLESISEVEVLDYRRLAAEQTDDDRLYRKAVRKKTAERWGRVA